MNKNKFLNKFIGLICCLCMVVLCGCDTPAPPVEITPGTSSSTAPAKSSVEGTTASTSSINLNDTSGVTITREPVCLVCEAPGTLTDGSEYVTIDYSNNQAGYIMVNYLGSASKVKLQLVGPNGVTYTYDLRNGYAAFPLTGGDGAYGVNVCENIVDSKYSVVYANTFSFAGIDEFGPYLYPNQYVFFDSTKETVKKGAELASLAEDELGIVTNVYNYIISNITYDYEKADTVASGYISDVDEILHSNTGICLDYAAVMTSMLRTQSIPTRLEVGYVGKDMVYHAWISVYIEEMGWLNGVIQFDGKSWSLVDPTFGSSTNEKKLKEYIGDGTNYSVKYVY